MILAIDTATRWTGLALHDGFTVRAEFGWAVNKKQTVELAPRIAGLLQGQEIDPAALKGIAVAIGPGSYTGLRIGLAIAKGLALVHDLPLIGVPTLDVTAAGIPISAAPALVVTVEAGRQRVIAGGYEAHDGRWQAAAAPEILTWDVLLAGLRAPTAIAGEISPEAREKIKNQSVFGLLVQPAAGVRRAGWLAELGWERLRAGRLDDAAALTPTYLRRPDGS